MKCKHFFITYDQYAPKGCKLHNIKTTQMPSIIIKQANFGKECVGFEEKKKKSNQNNRQ